MNTISVPWFKVRIWFFEPLRLHEGLAAAFPALGCLAEITKTAPHDPEPSRAWVCGPQSAA
jgi:hypothetical protein